MGHRKTVPPVHVWCATERKFLFEKLRMREGAKLTPFIAPPQAQRFCAAVDEGQHISVQGTTVVPYTPGRIAGCTSAKGPRRAGPAAAQHRAQLTHAGTKRPSWSRPTTLGRARACWPSGRYALLALDFSCLTLAHLSRYAAATRLRAALDIRRGPPRRSGALPPSSLRAPMARSSRLTCVSSGSCWGRVRQHGVIRAPCNEPEPVLRMPRA